MRRIVPVTGFMSALRALECPDAERMVEGLAGLLVARPQCAPPLGGSDYRVLHTNPYERFPALRLIYRFDDEALYLLEVELYDPLEPDPET